MKTETKTVVIFEDGDLDLLQKELPDSPCSECHSSKDGSCCGCPSEDEYKRLIKPYKDRDIYELALVLKRRTELMRNREVINKELARINRELPDQVKSIHFL